MRRKAISRKGPCRVYWGSHGCQKQRGHIGLHFCSTGCVPCDGVHIFGEDWDRTAYIAQVADWLEHQRRLGKGWPTHQPDDWRLPRRLEVGADRLAIEIVRRVQENDQAEQLTAPIGLTAAGPPRLRYKPETKTWEPKP